VGEALKLVFPEGEELLSTREFSLLDKDCVLFIPRIFPHPPNEKELAEMEALANATKETKAIVVQTPFWDLEIVPQYVLGSMGKVDILHAASKFISRLFQGVAAGETVEVGIPLRPLQHRTRPPASRRAGGVIASLHPRKNIEAYFLLASLLPDFHFYLILPFPPASLPNAFPHVKTENLPNITLLYDLTDEELFAFYASLTYFIVLSGGEGYCLPAREALYVGTPVIVPQNTVFLEWKGWDGVTLIETSLSRLPTGEVCRFPRLDEVANFLQTYPSCTRQISTPPVAPSVEECRDALLLAIDKFVSARKTSIFVGHETSSIWVTYPQAWGLGLTYTAKQWAHRLQGTTIPFHHVGSVPIDPRIPIIIPYRQGLFDSYGDRWCNQILNLVATCFRTYPNNPILLWLHCQIPPHLLALMRRWGVHLAATHPRYAQELGCPHLPLPIGAPPQPTPTPAQEFWLIWGGNFPQMKIFKEIYPTIAKLPIIFQMTFNTFVSDDAIEAASFLSNWGWCGGWDTDIHTLLSLPARLKIWLTPPLDDETLELLIDSASGYIILDDDNYALPMEVSARIPAVLRKGKPVLANCSTRSLPWAGYIPLLDFSTKDSFWKVKAGVALKQALASPNKYIPRGVPSVEVETQRVREVIFYLRSLRGEVV